MKPNFITVLSAGEKQAFVQNYSTIKLWFDLRHEPESHTDQMTGWSGSCCALICLVVSMFSWVVSVQSSAFTVPVSQALFQLLWVILRDGQSGTRWFTYYWPTQHTLVETRHAILTWNDTQILINLKQI